MVIYKEDIHVELYDGVDCYLAYFYLDEIGAKKISLKGHFKGINDVEYFAGKKSYTLSIHHVEENNIIKLPDDVFARFYECLSEKERRPVDASIAILRSKSFLNDYRDPYAMDIIYVYDSFYRQCIRVLYKDIFNSYCIVGVVYGNDNPPGLAANTIVNVVLAYDDYNSSILMVK